MDGVDSDFEDNDDSNYEDKDKEDIHDDGEHVSDLPSDHTSYAWWLPGDVPPSEHQQHCYTEAEEIDHMKVSLGGDKDCNLVYFPIHP
eukprot:5933341-Ditylum_brightwellii.AAC.1